MGLSTSSPVRSITWLVQPSEGCDAFQPRARLLVASVTLRGYLARVR